MRPDASRARAVGFAQDLLEPWFILPEREVDFGTTAGSEEPATTASRCYPSVKPCLQALRSRWGRHRSWYNTPAKQARERALPMHLPGTGRIKRRERQTTGEQPRDDRPRVGGILYKYATPTGRQSQQLHAYAGGV